jgi:hypothetical protein
MLSEKCIRAERGLRREPIEAHELLAPGSAMSLPRIILNPDVRLVVNQTYSFASIFTLAPGGRGRRACRFPIHSDDAGDSSDRGQRAVAAGASCDGGY